MTEDLRKLRDLAFQLVASKGTETLHAHQVRALAADYLRSLDALDIISRRPHDGPGTAYCPRCIARETLGLPPDDEGAARPRAALSPQEPSEQAQQATNDLGEGS